VPDPLFASRLLHPLLSPPAAPYLTSPGAYEQPFNHLLSGCAIWDEWVQVHQKILASGRADKGLDDLEEWATSCSGWLSQSEALEVIMARCASDEQRMQDPGLRALYEEDLRLMLRVSLLALAVSGVGWAGGVEAWVEGGMGSVQNSTVQHSTTHYSTVHYSTVQYNTAQGWKGGHGLCTVR
jgi:hypothetical protein